MLPGWSGGNGGARSSHRRSTLYRTGSALFIAMHSLFSAPHQIIILMEMLMFILIMMIVTMHNNIEGYIWVLFDGSI